MFQRKQLPPLLKEVLEVSQYLTLYQVESHPPCNFTFRDPLDNQVTVNLGTVPRCSCLPGNNDHCMHTFYVLRKLYQIHPEDPMLYQPQYTQDQLVDIFSGERAKNFVPAKGKKKEKGKDLLKEVQRKLNKEQNRQNADYSKQESQVQSEIKYETTQKSEREEESTPALPLRQAKEQQSSSSSSRRQKQPVSRLPSLVDSKEAVPNFKKRAIQESPQEQYEAPKNLQKGAICSICYEPLLNQTALLKCSAVCFNFFHTKCLRFWIDYQKKQDLQASCPMCRGKFPFNVLDRLRLTQRLYIKKYLSFQVNCIQCGIEIQGKLFRCLQCKEGNVCEQCYMGFKHPAHDRYLMRCSKQADWSPPADRSKGGMAKLEVSLKYVKQFKDQQQMKSLFGPNYEKFLQANLKKQTNMEYVIDSLTSVQKQIYKTYKKIDYEEKDIKCLLCRKGKITQMRRLSCKHFIDQKCLTVMLTSGERHCPFDSMPILPCFEALQLKLSKK